MRFGLSAFEHNLLGFVWVHNVNPLDDLCGTPLQFSAMYKHESIVELPLDRGRLFAEATFGTVLQSAVCSSSTSKAVNQILLDVGADINLTEGWHNSALQAATSEGNMRLSSYTFRSVLRLTPKPREQH